MIKASLRGLLQRKLRLALAVIAIVLSVGFMSGTFVLSDTLNARFGVLFETLNSDVAVQVSPIKSVDENGEQVLLTAAQLDALSKVDGVELASGNVDANGVIPFVGTTDEEIISQGAVGIGVKSDDPLGLLVLREGALPGTAEEVAISAHTAEQAKVGLGQQLKVFVPNLGEPKIYRVSGIVGFEGGRDSLAGETIVLFELGYAQESFYGQRDVFGSASFKARDGVSQEELKRRITAQLPAGFEAQTGEEVTEEQSNAVSGQFLFLTIILVAFSGIAGVVGIFLIYNTFNIVVAQRTRELALLRAMGASWGQVLGAVMLEALIVGLVGSALGLAAGSGLGVWAEQALTSGFELEGAGIVLAPRTVILAFAMGLLVTMLAAFIPAIRASIVPPLAAMREIAKPDKSLRGLTIAGLILAVPGAAFAILSLAVDIPSGNWLLVIGLILVFIGLMLLSPLLAKPVVAGLGFIVGRGQAGKLGVRNSLRNPRRTAVTAIALMIGVTLISAVATVTESFKSSLVQDIGRYDVSIMILGPNFAPPDGRTGFSPAAMEQVKKLPGVTDTATWYVTIDAGLGGQPFPVTATDVPTAQRMWKLETIDGSLRGLSGYEFVVDDNTAAQRGWKAGDTVKIRIGQVERDYFLVGVYKATPAVAGPVLSLNAVDDFPGQLAYQGFVSVSQGADVAATVTEIDKIMAAYPGVTVGDMSSFVEQLNQIFDVLLMVITILLGAALVIALLAILNTLMLSIVERTRELGLVRAIGLNRAGLVQMIGVESVLIAVLGALLGIAMGVGAGMAMSQAFINADFMTTIVVPWADLAQYVAVAIFFGIAAAIVPAWRAARLNVLEAIAYE